MTTLKRMSTAMMTPAWSALMATTVASTSRAVWTTAAVTAAMRRGMINAEWTLGVSPAASLTCGSEGSWRHPCSWNRRWSPKPVFVIAAAVFIPVEP